MKVLILIVVALVVLELAALLWLAHSVGSYKSYWHTRAQQTGQITYLAYGDSAAQGIGATSPARGYVGLVADRLSDKTNKSVRVVNVSKTGATMSDYLREQVAATKDIRADVVTIEIGANDIAGFEQEAFRSEFRKVLASLPDGAYVSNMPLFNSRPSSTDKAKQASLIIAEELRGYPKLNFVDLQKQTTEHQSIFGFAPDLFHPNNLSYKNWAEAFWIPIEKANSIIKA